MTSRPRLSTPGCPLRKGVSLRIGTWNLAGRWTVAHADLLLAQDCDVWLLTEVHERLDLEGFALHKTAGVMAADRCWAAVLAKPAVDPLPDPHPASAAALLGDLLLVSSILPWRSCGDPGMWGGSTYAEKMENTLRPLEELLRTKAAVWGGDWNQSLTGPEYAGSKVGRAHLQGTLRRAALDVPTAELPHCRDGIKSIDHIAVPSGTHVACARQVAAESGARRLSDHDMYVVETS